VKYPTEHQEQAALIKWARLSKARYPMLNMLYAIPNAAKRSVRIASMMKAEGMVSGVPDLHLAAPSGNHHGLFIEMKRIKGGKVSENQAEWLHKLGKYGYKTAVCYGWIEAKEEIENYISVSEVQQPNKSL